MRTLVNCVVTLVGFACLALPSTGSAQARQRSIDEFVTAQGTYCGGPLPTFRDCMVEWPVGNLIAFQKYVDGYRRFVRVDFPGLVDRYLASAGRTPFGTTWSGSITERPLQDGTAIVSVRLLTQNAPAWVRYNAWIDNGDGRWGPGDSLSASSKWAWGANAAKLAAGADPSLVDAEFKLVFVNPSMGAPMPDLYQFLFDPRYVGKRLYISITAHGAGTLAANAAELGLGAPGDPADLLLHQVGLLEVYANLPDAADPGNFGGIFNNGGWPAELLEIKPISGAR